MAKQTFNISTALARLLAFAQCVALLCVLATGCRAYAISDEHNTSDPQLIFDTGGHTDSIWSLAVDDKEMRIVSGSSDKSVRLWELKKPTEPSDRPVGSPNRFFGQIGADGLGEVYAVAQSPTERMTAVGGRMCRDGGGSQCGDIRIFDTDTGVLLSLLEADETDVISLDFSRDGALLASVGSSGKVRIWSTQTSKPLAEINFPGISPRRIKFVAGNSFAVAGSGGGLHIFELAGRELRHRISLSNEMKSLVLAVNDDQSLLAAGGSGGPVIVWQVDNWQKIRTLSLNGAIVTALSFGRGPTAHLLAAALKDEAKIAVFDVSQKRPGRVTLFSDHDNTITDIAALPDGRLASAGGNAKQIIVWHPSTGKVSTIFSGKGRTVQTVGFVSVARNEGEQSPDIKGGPPLATDTDLYLVWGYSDPCPMADSCPESIGPVQRALFLPREDSKHISDPFELTEKGTVFATGAQEETKYFFELQSEAGERLLLSDSKQNPGMSTLSLGSNPILSSHECCTAYSIVPEDNLLVAGGRRGELFALNLGDKAFHQLKGHSGTIKSIAISPDRKLLASSSTDQTIRLWDLKNFALVASILILEDEWIIWTPEGNYISSTDGDKHLLWQVNNGPGAAADVYSAKQFKTRFWKRGLVEEAVRAIGKVKEYSPKGHTYYGYGKSGDEAFGESVALDKYTNWPVGLLRPPPEFRINAPTKQRVRTDNGFVEIELSFDDAQLSNLDEIEVYSGARAATRVERLAKPFASNLISFRANLAKGDNEVRIIARGAAGETSEKSIWVKQTAKGALDSAGTLYVVAIGVNGSPPDSDSVDSAVSTKVNFASNDAAEFAKVIGETFGKKFSQVSKPAVLVSGGDIEPKASNILDAFDGLSKTKPEDGIVIFMAGHGVLTSLSNYVFLAEGAERNELGNWRTATVISKSQLMDALRLPFAGTKMLVVDTCRSDAAFDPDFKKAVADMQVTIYLATKSGKAYEDSQKKHGHFTEAFIRGITGGEGTDWGDTIEADEFGFWLRKDLKKRQTDQIPDYEPRPKDMILVRRH